MEIKNERKLELTKEFLADALNDLVRFNDNGNEELKQKAIEEIITYTKGLRKLEKIIEK